MLNWTPIGWRYAYKVEFCDEGDYASMDAYMGDKWRGLTGEVAG